MKWKRRFRQTMITMFLGFLMATGCLMLALWTIPFPEHYLEDYPQSPLVTDQTGRVMLAVVGPDEQIRHPVPLDEMSPWLPKAAIAIEDERFESHWGVDPIAVARAIGQNLASMSVKSGASTITMQVCRMMDDHPRTIPTKLTEAFRALQLEKTRDKSEILELYLNMIPCGSNIRGVDAASRKYFNKQAADLSLPEAALLAGLPQSPNRYRPDRHPSLAICRRNMVLYRMFQTDFITFDQYRRASREPLALAPSIHVIEAPHAAWMAIHRRPTGGTTTIDINIQRAVESLADRHAQQLPTGTQLAVAVIEIETGNLVALLGSSNYQDNQAGQVNGATALRSPGSTLKPFIYAAAFEDRRLTPDTLVPDIPIQRAGWEPHNFDDTFHGELPTDEALRRSLNIPAILTAEGVGLHRCIGLIESAGIHFPENAAQRAGSGIAVGAAETTLLDLVNGYATLGRSGTYRNYRLFTDEPTETRQVFTANTCSAIDEILSCRNRPPNGLSGLSAASIPWFMWKTGTSSGRRDAWAIGHNRRYAVGVWTGRFSGSGDPNLTGSRSAEPLLARLFTDPAIRNDTPDPHPPTPWQITNPLPQPAETQNQLQITSPRNGATYYTIDGTALIDPKCSNNETKPAWFLNGNRIELTHATPLKLAPGSYDLLCVADDSHSILASFTIRSQLMHHIPNH